jgi:hypothetical protein
MPLRSADVSARHLGGIRCRFVTSALIMVAFGALLEGPALAQRAPATSLEESRNALAKKLVLAEYADSQGDTWSWRLTSMSGCTVAIRQTIETDDAPLVTDYAVDLADVRTIRFAQGWVSVWTRRPTIWSRTYLRIGEPSEEFGDSLEVRFRDRRTARAAAVDLAQLGMLCRMAQQRAR